MTSKYHRPATADDACFVAAHLRAEDRMECLTASGNAPEVELPLAVATHGAEAVVAPNGEVIALCGVVPGLAPDLGIVWMLGTDSIVKHRVCFLREARKWLAEKHESFPRMGNVVDSRNTLHVRWLALLGFQFLGVIDLNGVPFFTFEKSQCAPQ